LAGVEPLRDIRRQKDIFGRETKVTYINQIDPLTAIAVLLMGEGAERIPIVILRGYKGIEFSTTSSMEDFTIPPEVDIYQPLLDVMKKT
jgi:coenzyme F420-0:L-glutamate ligase/coenzyme F420-1:gamma-L-glutamate ligase